MTVTELRTKARRLQVEKGVKFILVDYLQLVHGQTRDNRVQEVSEISQGLKNLARELKIPILAAAQLSRAMEARGGRPRLSDLRESGSIEQDADVVMFLYREDEEIRETVTCSIEKHRNGPVGSFQLFFNGKQVSFFEVEKMGN
jgi:replicative DNA helicase